MPSALGFEFRGAPALRDSIRVGSQLKHGRVTGRVIAGTGSNSTHEAVEFTRLAHEAGADGCDTRQQIDELAFARTKMPADPPPCQSMEQRDRLLQQ